MKPEQAMALLKALGSNPSYDGGLWVKSDCPLAVFLHKNHSDSNPSFGISVPDDRPSKFNCFSCNKGSMEELVQSIELYLSHSPTYAHRYDIKTARMLLDQEEVEVMPLPEYNEFGAGTEAPFQEWPSYFIESFLPATHSSLAMDYLAKRGVSKADAERHNLRYDIHRSMIMHPYSNVYGLLSGARGRSIQPHGMQHYDYTWNNVNNAKYVWYNEGVLQSEQPIVVVEGQFDLYRVERVYPNVIANLTAKPSPAKMKKLQQCEGVILLLDNDPTADKAITLYSEYFQKSGIQWTYAQPPKDLDSNGKLIKADPDSMGEAWIWEQLKDLLDLE